jgi:hypothetical protein
MTRLSGLWHEWGLFVLVDAEVVMEKDHNLTRTG